MPRYEVKWEVFDDVQHCAEHGRRTLIGCDRTESLEFTPPQLKVRVTLMPKYVCADAAECGVSEPRTC